MSARNDTPTAAEIWIFGYGSLVWRPAFPHDLARQAWITGFVRRFWQGSTDHRGLPGRPGRVVTIVREDDPELAREGWTSSGSPEDRRCWGTAYRVAAVDAQSVLDELDHRERGGYERVEIEVGLAGADSAEARVPGHVYIAGPANERYLGPAPLGAIARQVSQARGPSGANTDYVFELAAALRRMHVVDAHVFALEEALRPLVLDRRPPP